MAPADPLADQRPGDERQRFERARGLARHYRASALTALGRFDESRPVVELAVEDLRSPDVIAQPRADLELVAALDLQSTLAYRHGRLDEALEALEDG